MDKVNIGVLGTGIIMRGSHLPALKDQPHAQVVAAANLHPESLGRLAEDFHIPTTYTDFADMAADPNVDAVVVGLAQLSARAGDDPDAGSGKARAL